MTAGETKIQQDYVMKFICRAESEGGLGYRDTPPNIVSPDLFIPSQLIEFIQEANRFSWKALMSRYKNDEERLTGDIKEEVKRRMLTSSNVATFLNKNQKITFQGESLQLFFVSGTELRGDADFKKNIFSAVKELPHTVACDGVDIEHIRPDVTFFVNGIYLGYMELKTNIMGQSAESDGRGKIIGDYLRAIQLMDSRKRNRPDDNTVDEDRREALMIFEKAIHLTACDINETYVWRNVQSYTDAALKAFESEEQTIEQYRNERIVKDFKAWPLSSPSLSQDQAFKETMRALYAKKMIEKEILIYNFIKYKYEKVDGRKSRTSNTGTLITPRPKQKFGCDKIMARVSEMLDKEKDPDYYIRQLREELTHLSVAPDKIEDIIRRREACCNNKYVYSLLLQYAAGFGKSNIIGWTALQLKDLRYEGQWAYDKILIVVDRLQLRDQLDTMMMDMNIDKSMFVEVRNQSTFVRALSGEKRIIVVNIQKFLELRNAILASDEKLRKMRVVFLIDEIHRSTTGETGEEMIDIFSQLADVIDGEVEADGSEAKKKNLIIGFTATPTEKVLARFGEFKSSAKEVPLWVPFDSYSMTEAIRDGYILDPTKHIIPVKLSMKFYPPEDFDPATDNDKKVHDPSRSVYENETRMDEFARFVVDRCLSLVYGKIRGTGKAMLAVSSIPIAIRYFKKIKKYMREQCEPEDSRYHQYAKAPVYIIYSDRQGVETCESLNSDKDGDKSEAKVIEDFKNSKNGIIIVVDKLQTGFDEPHLHTLFLDKEINDINAVQTVSRVDRICKYKKECHVVDMSWKNVNVENIRKAFKKYCHTVISDFNPGEVVKEIELSYKYLLQSYPYTRWFLSYKKNPEDGNTLELMEADWREWITREFQLEQESKEEIKAQKAQGVTGSDLPDLYINKARLVRQAYGTFYNDIMDLKDVIEIDKRYYDGIFQSFWLRYCNLYGIIKSQFARSEFIDVEVDTDDELPGITVEEDPDDDDTERGNGGPHRGGGSSTEEDVLTVIRLWNEGEKVTADEIKKWGEEIMHLFDGMKADTGLMAVVNDDEFSSELKEAECRKYMRKFQRRLRLRSDIEKAMQLSQLIGDSEEQLIAVFMQSLRKKPRSLG